jgi:hypothetical protein
MPSESWYASYCYHTLISLTELLNWSNLGVIIRIRVSGFGHFKALV